MGSHSLPGDLPYPGIKPEPLASPASQADSLPSEPPGKPIHYLYSFKLGINEPDFENQNGVLTIIPVPL